MTIQSEFRKRVIGGRGTTIEVYKCLKCFCLVLAEDRQSHRAKVHRPNAESAVLTDNIRAVIEEMYGSGNRIVEGATHQEDK